MGNKRGVSFCLAVLAVLSLFLTSDRVCAGKSQTIAIFPFEVLSPDDVAFLGKGLTRMICSRVGDTGEIQVQCRRKSLEDSNIEIVPGALNSLAGEKTFAGIDFLVKGSLTIMGATISTDAELIDLTKGRVVCYFHESGASREDIVRHAAVISGKIKAVVLGGAVPAVQPETFGSTGVPLVSKEVETGPGAIAVDQSSKPEVPAPVSKATVSVDPVFRSRTFNSEFTGMGAGDVDGDGHADIVLMDEHSLNLFSLQNGTLVKKGEFKGKRYHDFKAVDVADVNRNGKAEIFVTCVDRNAGVRSFVLEWNQGAFNAIVKESDWYFRVVSMDGKKRLFGQRGGYSELFSGGVWSLAWDGAGFEKAEAVALPENVDIFSFVRGDLLGAGAEQILWLDDQGKLSLSRTAGQVEWSNSSSFGSTPFFLGEKAGQDAEDQQRYYLNSRMAVADLDQDGRSEAIVVHNRDLSKGFLSRFRKFTAGSIKCLAWNSSGMRIVRETAQVDGYIADWALEDLDNDGKGELIYCITRDKGTLLNKKRTIVAVEKL